MQFLKHPRISAYTSHPSRLIFDNPSLGELVGFIEVEQNGKLKDKIQENYDKKIASLADRVKELETAGKSPEDIKKELLKEKSKIIQEAINQALKDLKITRKVNGKDEQISYSQLTNHPNPDIKKKVDAIYDGLDEKITADIGKAVDQYVTQKGVITDKATAGLKAAPGLQPSDSTAANAETARLQEVLDKRRGIIAKSKGERAEILIDKTASYRARTSMADTMTAPTGGIIGNYETDYKFWSNDVTNDKNPTRFRLQGFLYANDIFAGGGAAGQAAMNEAIKEPLKLSHRYIIRNKLTVSDLETGMALKSYFEEAQKYTPFDRAIGTVAGLLRLADKNVPDADSHRRYLEYLRGKFEELKSPERKDNEEKQLEFLYGLQSLPEFIGSDPNWKTAFSNIDNMTDPDAPGAKITDYPGTFSENKNNKTRWNLNGYLYSVYLFSGRNQASVNVAHDRAVRMYDDSGYIDKDFTQEMIEGTAKNGFGLKGYLVDASKYSSSEQVKGVIAGLLKQADDAGNSKYRKYLEAKFKGFQPGDAEDAQLMMLSTIKSPGEADKEVLNNFFTTILEASVAASKQHNQVALEKKFKASFEKDPQSMSIDEITKLGNEVKAELDNFVITRANFALKDLETRYNTLLEKNTALGKISGKTPLYKSEELNPLSDSIKADAADLSKAKGIQKEGALDGAINNNYLSILSGAEKTYFNLVEQLKAMQTSVDEQATSKAPDQNKPLGDNGNGAFEKTETTLDAVTANWKKAERVEPLIKDYSGPMTADSASTVEKVIARDNNGAPINWKGDKSGLIPNGTEVMRTEKDAKIQARKVENLNFVRVHAKDNLENHGFWIPEEQLYKPGTSTEKSDQTAAQKTDEYGQTQAQGVEQANAKALEQIAGKPKLFFAPIDYIFQRVQSEVEMIPAGSTFDISYNGRNIGCRVQKFPDGYHLTFNSEEAGQGNIVFPSVQAIRYSFERGEFYQRLGMQTMLFPQTWARYKSEGRITEVTNLNRTGDWTLTMETGGSNVNLSVGSDGRINYTIRREHIGPNGENERTGFASDMTQLADVIRHSNIWADNYDQNQSNPAIIEREKTLTSLMDARTFEALSSQIGEKYYFSNFYSGNYSFMYLNWDNQQELFARNRSFANPMLEVKLDPNNRIQWKLQSQTGENNIWVGTSNVANNIAEMASQIEKVKQNPGAVMTTPATQLPNLGGFGYSLDRMPS